MSLPSLGLMWMGGAKVSEHPVCFCFQVHGGSCKIGLSNTSNYCIFCLVYLWPNHCLYWQDIKRNMAYMKIMFDLAHDLFDHLLSIEDIWFVANLILSVFLFSSVCNRHNIHRIIVENITKHSCNKCNWDTLYELFILYKLIF